MPTGDEVRTIDYVVATFIGVGAVGTLALAVFALWQLRVLRLERQDGLAPLLSVTDFRVVDRNWDVEIMNVGNGAAKEVEIKLWFWPLDTEWDVVADSREQAITDSFNRERPYNIGKRSVIGSNQVREATCFPTRHAPDRLYGEAGVFILAIAKYKDLFGRDLSAENTSTLVMPESGEPLRTTPGD